ncbi:hypothetical protein B7463_g10948, partial [Scytalidium lignicola]
MALQERSVNAQWPQHLKKGPKIKPLEKRTYTPRLKPVTLARRSYTRERKIEVLKFLLYHKVVVTPSATYQRVKARSGMPLELEPEPVNSFNSITRYRLVTIQEASEFWKIAYGIIKRWWLEKDKILAAKILNMDETPIPFEHLDGYSYDMVSTRTVSGCTDRSGWNKRQATLILYIYANGIQRIKPKLIFYGIAGASGQIYNKEKHLYYPGVTVEFNSTVYNNEELFMQWIDEELILIANQIDTLLVMDVAIFHKTDLILERLKSANITTALIPPSCTSLLQPLDTVINSLFKQWLREESDQYMESIESEHPNFKWSTSDKRIMTTHIVAKAVQRLEQEKKEMVAQSFIQCGISIRPDGSEDSQIKVKDILSIAIDFTGWESIDFGVEYVKNELFKEVPEAIDNMEEVILEREI